MPHLPLIESRRVRLPSARVICRRVLLLALCLSLAATAPFAAIAQESTATQGQTDERDDNVIRDVPFVTSLGGFRRALLGVLGFVSAPDQLDKDQKGNALVGRYYQGPDEQSDLQFLQNIAPSFVYLPSTLQQAQGFIGDVNPGSASGVAGAQTGRVLQATNGQTGDAGGNISAADPCNPITDLRRFYADCAATTKQRGIGRMALLLTALSSVAARTNAATTAALIAGAGVREEFQGEGSSASTTGDVRLSLAETKRAADAALTEIPALEAATTYGAPEDQVTGTTTNKGIPANEPALEQVCTRTPDGETVCLGATAVHQITGHRAGGGGCGTCGAAGGAGAGILPGGLSNGFSNFFGGGVPSLAQQMLGSNLSLFQNLLGPNRFWNLAQNLFRPSAQGGNSSAGSAGNLPNPPVVESISEHGNCAETTASLPPAQVILLAQVLGMHTELGSWRLSIQPTETAVGVPAVNLENNQPVTLQASDFRPQDRCVWTVVGPERNNLREVVIISDTTDAAGTEFRLLMQSAP